MALGNLFVMDLDCIQLSPTVPLPPERQLATCHTVQALTSNRGANALVPARPAKMFSLAEKKKKPQKWGMGGRGSETAASGGLGKASGPRTSTEAGWLHSEL